MVLRRLFLVGILVVSCRPSGRPPARPPARVVSPLPSFTEILFAIGAGAQVVGRTQRCGYPPAALSGASVREGLPPHAGAGAAPPADHHRPRQLSRSARQPSWGAQRLQRRPRAVRAGIPRDHRRARSALDRRAVRFGDCAVVCEAARMARRSGGARRALPAPHRLAVRAAGAALGRGDRTAPADARTMRWAVLLVIVVLAMIASIVLGPA